MVKKGRGKDRKKRKRRRDRLTASERAARERAVANTAVNRATDLSLGLLTVGTVVGTGLALKNKKFRKSIGKTVTKGSEAAGAAVGYVATPFKKGAAEGGAAFGADEFEENLSSIPGNIKKGKENFFKELNKNGKITSNDLGVATNKAVKRVIPAAKKTKTFGLGVKARKAVNSKVKKDIKKTKVFFSDLVTRGERKKIKKQGFVNVPATAFSNNSPSSDFWLEFSNRRKKSVEFSRKRKPHSEATKKKISASLKGRKRSRSQNFNDTVSGLNKLVNAGSKIVKTYDNRRLLNQELGIRETRRQISAASPIINTVIKTSFGGKARVDNVAYRIRSEAFNRDSLTREALAKFKIGKG